LFLVIFVTLADFALVQRLSQKNWQIRVDLRVNNHLTRQVQPAFFVTEVKNMYQIVDKIQIIVIMRTIIICNLTFRDLRRDEI